MREQLMSFIAANRLWIATAATAGLLVVGLAYLVINPGIRGIELEARDAGWELARPKYQKADDDARVLLDNGGSWLLQSSNTAVAASGKPSWRLRAVIKQGSSVRGGFAVSATGARKDGCDLSSSRSRG